MGSWAALPGLPLLEYQVASRDSESVQTSCLQFASGPLRVEPLADFTGKRVEFLEPWMVFLEVSTETLSQAHPVQL